MGMDFNCVLIHLTHMACIVFALTVIPLQAYLECPNNAVAHVYACLGNLVGEDGQIKMLAGEDAHEFYQKCVDGSFDVTVHCVQTIITQCRGTEQEKDVLHTLNPMLMKRSFDAACEKKDIYLEKAPCVARYKDRIQKCCKSIHRQFTQAKEEAYSLNKSVDLMCSFINGITGCTEAPIRRYCDPVTAETIVDLMSGITPKTCIPYRGNGASRMTKYGLLIMTAVLSLCIIFRNM